MSSSVKHFDVIVLGGGAAGLMSAMEAGKRGRSVAILERAEKIGKKILISGGGRCNFTNIHCRPENFLSSNPHFCRSALARYTPADFIALVQKHGITYHEKTLGQLFCDHSSRQIMDMLESECASAGVAIFTNTSIESVFFDNGFHLTSNTTCFSCESLVVATGGLSIPKMGATDLGYRLAKQFGLNLIECRPALVPLTFAPQDLDHYRDLTGISTEVIASTSGQRFREKMLFTHRGLSGPAILQVSSYWQAGAPPFARRPREGWERHRLLLNGEAILIDLAPGRDLTSPMIASPSHRDLAAAKAIFRAALPARLADRWLDLNAPQRWMNHDINELERKVHNWAVVPSGTEGYDKAEVTAGGVDTDELSAKTMEAKKRRGLFFIGEVVDVTGQLGGFNFQWAWASGFAAGQAV